MNTSTFNSLDLSQEYCEKLEQLGITIPTGIQQQVIPLIKNNKNIIFQEVYHEKVLSMRVSGFVSCALPWLGCLGRQCRKRIYRFHRQNRHPAR